MDNVVIKNGNWTTRDFELMAAWYGIDAVELQKSVIDSGEFENNFDDYVAECWGTMESAARELGGTAKEPFDFVEASNRFAGIGRQPYLPPLEADAAVRFELEGSALVDRGGQRFELALVAEGWDYFVCPDLPDEARTIMAEFSFSGLTPEQEAVVSEHGGPAFDELVSDLVRNGNPPRLRIVAEGKAAADSYRADLEDFATLDLRPQFVSASASDEAQDLLAADPYLMHRHDSNRPDSADVDAGPSMTPLAPPSPAELRGFPMTKLLEEAHAASASLGPNPSAAALERYENAMAEIDRREAPITAPSKDVADYLSKALEAYRSMTGWQGLSADEALECFVADLSSGRIPVQEPKHDYLELKTPIGTLVASSSMSYEDSHVIEVSLEKPDGMSGQVAMVEVVSGDLADGYATPLHTFCWDGNEESPGTVVDCDHEGEYMQYVGYEHGAVRGGDAVREMLDAEALDAPTSSLSPTPSMLASSAKAAAESGPQVAKHSDARRHAL